MSQNSFVINIATEVGSWTGEFIGPNNKLPLCSHSKTLLKLFGISSSKTDSSSFTPNSLPPAQAYSLLQF